MSHVTISNMMRLVKDHFNAKIQYIVKYYPKTIGNDHTVNNNYIN